jgi:antitoxin (DNA-binding transcriptional repressor) of toxin-antitoxin stability system
MGILSILELNDNVADALARVEAGETLDITRNSRVIAELRPKVQPHPEADSAERRALAEEMLVLMRRGLPGLGGPASYEERTE